METEARESSDENTFHYQDLESVNKGLSSIGESPVIKSKLQGGQYPKEKLIQIKSTFVKSMLIFEDIDDESEMIKQLKEKFYETQEKSVKVQILTLLPMSWSIKKIENEFKASNYMVRKAKTLVKSGGILSTPNPNYGHNLHDDTIVMVQNFYESDEISRVMPGKKDCVSIKVNDTRILVQKILLLGNLKEVYRQFKDQFPAEKIGFSRFAKFRPKHCVLAGASGTHAVCVCTIHQNTKLMMIAGKLAELTANREVHLKHYNYCYCTCIMIQLLCIYFRRIWYSSFKKNFQKWIKYFIFQMDLQLSTKIE